MHRSQASAIPRATRLTCGSSRSKSGKVRLRRLPLCECVVSCTDLQISPAHKAAVGQVFSISLDDTGVGPCG